MNLLIAVALLTAVIWGLLYLVEYVRDDGLRHRPSSPPRSHQPDTFEPPWDRAA